MIFLNAASPTQLTKSQVGDAHYSLRISAGSIVLIIPHAYIQLFHHQSYGHTFPVPNEPTKSKVHQIPSHPVMICIELPHSFFSQCSMVLPSIISLSRILRYYRNHYSYWFFLLYCSIISRSFLNFSTLSGFIFPTFITFLLAFNQFKWSCSSIRCRDGFRCWSE